MSLIPPNNNSELIINDFILYATGHLASVSGIINTVSLYPAAPTPIPGPGIILWTGYQIPPASPPVPQLDVTPILMNEQQLTISTLASIDGLSIDEATALAFDTDLLTNPPDISLDQANLLFDESLLLTPIPDPTPEELNEERRNLGDTGNESEKEQTPNPTPEQVPNYKSNIKVPDDVILAMRKWGVGVDNPKERAHFLAQCSHESGGFKAKVENLNYGYKGLLGVFSKYFKTEEKAKDYERKPKKIASYVYGNRMGNGDEVSEEGWAYRGRGYIQLTGKSNYTSAEKVINDGIVKDPDKVESKYPGDSACFFWTANYLKNKISTDDDVTIEKITKAINGGRNGIEDRKKKFLIYWNELQKDPTLWS
jgi:putative chitinase